MKRFMLIILIVTVTGLANATELPKMSYMNQQGFLKKFPLNEATALDVINAYGPPQSKIDGLPGNSEVWTYYKKRDSVTFTFHLKGGKVYDIINRWPGGFQIKKERKARKLQGLED